MKKFSLHAFVLPFHAQFSRSHITLLESPLKNHISFQFHCWDGTKMPHINNISEPLLFFQYPPPKNLISDPNKKIIWIPMWDHIKSYPHMFWKDLPKYIKIVSFSRMIADVCQKFELNCLPLKYYSSLGINSKLNWKQYRNMFYWNRTGLIGQDDLSNLCHSLRINTLYFQNQLDPGLLTKLNYSLPTRLGDTEVICLPNYLPRKDYVKILNNTHVYIAPRNAEGIGLSFLEAFSFGSVVFAFDAPTMSEYITHKKNGYLFKYSGESKTQKVDQVLKIRLPFILGGRNYRYPLKINWQEIENLNIEMIGNTAYRDNIKGVSQWQKQIPILQKFLTDW